MKTIMMIGMKKKLIIVLIVAAFVIITIAILHHRSAEQVGPKTNFKKMERKMTKRELRREVGELRGIVRLLKKNDFMSAKAANEYGVTPLQFELLMNSWGLDTISTEEINSIDEKLFEEMEGINNSAESAP